MQARLVLKDQEEIRIGPGITSQRRVGKALNLRIREKLHNLRSEKDHKEFH